MHISLILHILTMRSHTSYGSKPRGSGDSYEGSCCGICCAPRIDCAGYTICDRVCISGGGFQQPCLEGLLKHCICKDFFTSSHFGEHYIRHVIPGASSKGCSVGISVSVHRVELSVRPAYQLRPGYDTTASADQRQNYDSNGKVRSYTKTYATSQPTCTVSTSWLLFALQGTLHTTIISTRSIHMLLFVLLLHFSRGYSLLSNSSTPNICCQAFLWYEHTDWSAGRRTALIAMHCSGVG